MKIEFNGVTYNFVDFEQPYPLTKGKWGVFVSGKKLPEDNYYVDSDCMQIELYDLQGEIFEKVRIQAPPNHPKMLATREQYESENSQWEHFIYRGERTTEDYGVASTYDAYRHKETGEVRLHSLPHPNIDEELSHITIWESDYDHRLRWLKLHYSN
ncbi:hypothetical protein [Scytonema sp. NUACC26]|uniref:hypothetical protein n=1 Tax=Scytonema sp. NUACC26 TaxID=3140176 RepID=UPI0034DBCCED